MEYRLQGAGCRGLAARSSTEALLTPKLERRRGDELDRGVSLVGPHRDELLLSLVATTSCGCR